MKKIIGIILIVAGSYFAYQGYETKQTFAAKVERETTEALRNITGNETDYESDTNLRANLELFGGGAATLIGLVILITGFTDKK
ncbi:MAG: hypothetical protein C0598_05865 [Marinilabiliales bacterium]|mgnify:CR=1 FL=1|nr:MAG: hypothetical protein C0598_05865 [Marinilabiliales bacterium]